MQKKGKLSLDQVQRLHNAKKINYIQHKFYCKNGVIMETIVISLGGSVLLGDDIDSSYYTELKRFLLSQQDKKIFIIVGGGPPARNYISRARSLQICEKFLDSIGIAVTRVNALFLACQIQESVYMIPHSTQEALQSNQSIVIMGGTTPGHSTDFVGAEIASMAKADLFIIATNVDGVFDDDPRKNPNVNMYQRISAVDLLKKYGSRWDTAGSNMVIDGPALQKIQKEHVQTIVVNGKNIPNLRKVINHQPFHGTTITV
jgi:uridylate kinase